MSLFPHDLKLYHFLKKDSVSLSIKSSDSHVMTFWMSHTIFQTMIKDSYSSSGFSGDHYYVLVKKDFVRFSKSNKEIFVTHFRIDVDKWKQLTKEYNLKLNDKSSDEHFSVVVT